MDGADAGTGQHGIGRFRHHGHVDGDHVALLDAARLHGVGQAADVLVQFLIGDLGVVLGVVAFPDDGDLIAALGQVPVDAVDRGVQTAVFVPLDGHVAVVVADVLDLGVGLHPIQALALLAPEGVRVVDGLLVHFQVLVVGAQ